MSCPSFYPLQSQLIKSEDLGSMSLICGDSQHLPMVARIGGYYLGNLQCLSKQTIDRERDHGIFLLFESEFDLLEFIHETQELGYKPDWTIKVSCGEEKQWHAHYGEGFAEWLQRIRDLILPQNLTESWIIQSSPLIQREFLAGYQSGLLSQIGFEEDVEHECARFSNV